MNEPMLFVHFGLKPKKWICTDDMYDMRTIFLAPRKGPEMHRNI